MAMLVDPPNGVGNRGKHYYTMWQTLFEIDTKYLPIKPIGRGAYGIVCSSINCETNEKVAIKKIHNVFDNRVDALRTLRELKLLRNLRHENVISLKDIMMPPHRKTFRDVYLVYELMDTDLHQIIKSSQALSNDHCQYFLFQLGAPCGPTWVVKMPYMPQPFMAYQVVVVHATDWYGSYYWFLLLDYPFLSFTLVIQISRRKKKRSKSSCLDWNTTNSHLSTLFVLFAILQLSPFQVLLVFKLLRGLKYIHSANILHRDLKPGNLLVNANCELKICDFGLARASSGKGQFMTEYVVTRWYRAPELLLCCDYYGTSIDVWSVGCIFAELLGRKPIFPGTECLNQLKLIINVLGTMGDSDISFIDNPKARKYIKSLPYTPSIPIANLYPGANPLAIDLLQKMLVFDPSKRISVDEALQHPYMSPLYDPNTNPPAEVPADLDIDENLGEEMIREMIWKEVLYYHPEISANSC